MNNEICEHDKSYIMPPYTVYTDKIEFIQTYDLEVGRYADFVLMLSRKYNMKQIKSESTEEGSVRWILFNAEKNDK